MTLNHKLNSGDLVLVKVCVFVGPDKLEVGPRALNVSREHLERVPCIYRACLPITSVVQRAMQRGTAAHTARSVGSLVSGVDSATKHISWTYMRFTVSANDYPRRMPTESAVWGAVLMTSGDRLSKATL